MHAFRFKRGWLVIVIGVLGLALLLAACGDDDDDDATLSADDLAVSDAWVRATVPMESGGDSMDAEMGSDMGAESDSDASESEMDSGTDMDAEPDAGSDTDSDTDSGMDMAMDDGLLSAAFMTITNSGDADATLISASVDPAITETVELHETALDENDVMRMRPVEGGIVIPAGGSVELKPGGLHIMLLDVQQNLMPDDTVTLTLTFEGGVTLDVTASVRALDAMP